MKRLFPIALVLGVALIFSPSVFAGQIQNLDVTPTGNQVLIEWDKLTDSEMYDEDGGYVIQYSTVQNDIRNDKPYRNQLKQSQDTLTLRAAGFDRDKTYFFRVYSLRTDGRKKHLNNGSKIMKWEWKTNGTVASEFIASNDPVIVDNTSSSNVAFNFGKLRAEKFANSAHMKWSRPSLGTNEYDGFTLVLSKNDDLSDPIAELVVPTTMTTAFFEGLTAKTKYYASGYFKKGSTQFGKSETITFTTLPAFSARQQSTYERRVLKRGNLGIRHNIGGTSTSTTAAATTTTSTSSTTDVTARITELKSLIKKYQTELRTLEKTQTSSSTRTTSRTRTSRTRTSTTSSKNSRLQSIRDRLKARRASRSK